MKTLYLILISCLITMNTIAQIEFPTFLEVEDTPFEHVVNSSITFSDIDNDGYDDVLLTGLNNYNEFIAKLYMNDGFGVFVELIDTPFQGVYSGENAFSDVNNDGFKDLLLTGRTSSDVNITKLYFNDGEGNFEEDTLSTFEGVYSSSIAFADVDNDDDQDVLITGINNEFHHTTILYTNGGDGYFEADTTISFIDTTNALNTFHVTETAFVDINNDSLVDIITVGTQGYWGIGSATSLYINEGNGQFSSQIVDFTEVGAYAVSIIDFNNDGYQDVLLNEFVCVSCWWSSGYYTFSTQLYQNNSGGSFSQVTDLPFSGYGPGLVNVADVNGDGYQDVLITGINDSDSIITELYLNDNDNNFIIDTNLVFEDDQYSSSAFSDIDGDGDQDLLISGVVFLDYFITKLYENVDSALKIGENMLFDKVSIYPNPTQGNITIEWNEDKKVDLKIYSLNGQLMHEKNSIQGPEFNFNLNVKAGIYILELTSDNETHYHKLIIQ